MCFDRQPAYALIGSLNGVHIFGESHGVTLCSTQCKAVAVTWKVYHDSIRLVLIRGSECVGESSDNKLLDLVFASLVLILGLDSLISTTNIERLKRDLKASYPIIDELISRSVNSDDSRGFSHLVHCAECILVPEQHQLQAELEKFIEGADSTYGCLLLCGQVICATKNFWSLSNSELVLLPLLVSLTTCTVSRDVPIYLPDKSPNVPFRMLVVRLSNHINVVALCGPTPTLVEITRIAVQSWAAAYPTLEAFTMLIPWNIAPSILSLLDNAIIGLLLVNYDHKRCVSCVHMNDDTRSRSLNAGKRTAALKAVYRAVVGPILQPPAMPPEDLPNTSIHQDHQPLETYMMTDSYKVYVLQSSPYHLLVLYPPALPTHIARQVTRRTLETLTKSKVPKL
ncbi:fuzzy planar cell polarity protein-like protein isoform X2 [Oratosquilla oratoria]|uniref:fuzzy planar cell polarity protein-like protein isoform X2 n=1 Tax=Oratosquilla oratoria TaxID=337810 RepID=UPI003F768365